MSMRSMSGQSARNLRKKRPRMRTPAARKAPIQVPVFAATGALVFALMFALALSVLLQAVVPAIANRAMDKRLKTLFVIGISLIFDASLITMILATNVPASVYDDKGY